MTDRENAIGIITRVAAELVRLDGIPDPDCEEFKPTGKRQTRELCKATHFRGRSLIAALELLKRDVCK